MNHENKVFYRPEEAPSEEKWVGTSMLTDVDTRALAEQAAQEERLEVGQVRSEIKAFEEKEKSQSFLSPEKKAEVVSAFTKLKEVLERKNLRPETKNFLLNGEISAVLAGVKPASHRSEPKEVKFFFSTIKKGINKEELEEVVQEFGCQALINEYDEPGLQKEYSVEIYNNANVAQALEESGAFSEEEVKLAAGDFGLLYQQLLEKSGSGDYQDAARLGYAYGYPAEDVRAFIENYQAKKLANGPLPGKEKIKSAHIDGLQGSITWASFHPEAPDVKRRVGELNEVFKIEKDVLGDKWAS